MNKKLLTLYLVSVVADVTAAIFGCFSGSWNVPIGFGFLFLLGAPLYFGIKSGKNKASVYGLLFLALLRVVVGASIICAPFTAMYPIRYHIVALSILFVSDLLSSSAMFLFLGGEVGAKRTCSRWVLLLPLTFFLVSLGINIGCMAYAIPTLIQFGFNYDPMLLMLVNAGIFFGLTLAALFIRNKNLVLALSIFLIFMSFASGFVIALCLDYGHYIERALRALLPHLSLIPLLISVVEFLYFEESIYSTRLKTKDDNQDLAS